VNPPPPRLTGRAWALLIALSLLWGGSFLFIGVAVRELPVLTLMALRVGIGALGLAALMAARGEALPLDRRALAALAGMGLLMCALPFSLIGLAQQHIPSGLAAILNATTPLFGVLAAHLLTADEKLTRLKGLGVLAGFGGVLVLMGGPAALAGPAPLWPILCCLGASLAYGLGGVWGRRVRRLGLSPLAGAAGQVAAAAVLLVPLALLVDRPWALPPPSFIAVAAVLALALLSTTLAYILFFRIVAIAGSGNVLLVTFLSPPWSILFGALLLGEALLPRHIAGLALIGLGLALIDGRLFARR
jgi:drug/metabolite transporter (DMT)-like permease